MIPRLKNSRQRRKESHSTCRVVNDSQPKNGRISRVTTLSGDSSDPFYEVELLNRNTLRKRGVKIKSSTSWIDCAKTPNGGLNVPYIDRLGRFTGTTLYKWSCDPRSLVTTVISTVANRILTYARRHNKSHVVKQYSKALLGAAAYYSMSRNSHFWDRILFFCRNLQKNGKLVHKTRLFFSSKWDDNKRFVISQVIFQTNWLLFRALRPRDKSLFYDERIKRTIWSNPDSAPSPLDITNTVRDFAYAMSSPFG